MRKRNMSMKEIASTTRRRGTMRATLKGAMEVWAAIGVFLLLFLASLAYVGFGGTLALEASPVAEAETSTAAAAAQLADVGGALRKENVSATSEKEEQ